MREASCRAWQQDRSRPPPRSLPVRPRRAPCRGTTFLFLAAVVVVLAAGAGSCLAETRHALVIGNGQYGNVPALRNAVADARAMRDRLAATGFDVTYRENADRRSMNRAVDEFVGKLSSDSVALLYYAGHGVQIGATNYLIPTDIRADSASDVANDAVDLSRVLEKVTSTQARFALAIVDACRDNPFRVAGRSLGVQRGLAPPTTTADGVMVVYSAGANQAALDTLSDRDPDPNGVFTREWLRVMMTPGLSVQAVATQVRQSVASLARSVGHAQTPAVYDQSLGSFEFVPASATDSVPAPTSAAAAPPAPVAPSQPSSPPAPPPVLASALLLPQQPPLTTRTATFGQGGAPIHDCDRLAQPPRGQLLPDTALVDGVPDGSLDATVAQAACAAALAEWPEEARFKAYAARVAAKRGANHDQVRLFRSASVRGNAYAQDQLGLLLANGTAGVERDDREAARLFRMAAEQGLAAGQSHLASMYFDGRGVLGQDEREAARLWRLAADQGDAEALRSLGAMYAAGRGGLAQDQGEADRLLRRAAEQSSALAPNRQNPRQPGALGQAEPTGQRHGFGPG